MRALHYSVVMKRELSKKAKLSIFKAVFVPILTYGHESWVMTERMRSQVQASEMRFLRRIEGVTLFNKMRSSEIRKSLNIEPLLLRIERSQLRWFGHVSRMPQERLPKQALHAKANGRRPVGRPRTRWTDYIENLGWNGLGLRPSEMMEVMEDREVWRLNLELLPPQPSRKSGQWRKKILFTSTIFTEGTKAYKLHSFMRWSKLVGFDKTTLVASKRSTPLATVILVSLVRLGYYGGWKEP